MIKIFISHSSKDVDLADALVHLIRDAFSFRPDDIRCTSVEGHQLSGGADTNEQLRIEVQDSDFFIGLISQNSLRSTYVVFELGARWGAGKHLLPLLAPGLDPSALKGPIASLNALRCDSGAQLHQMISEISEKLKSNQNPAASYQGWIDRIVKMRPDSLTEETKNARESIPEEVPKKNNDSEFINAEEIIKQHCKRQWSDDFEMFANCQNKQREALRKLKIGKPNDIPVEIFDGIRRKAREQWPNDFEMRLYTENKQIDAYRKVRNDL